MPVKVNEKEKVTLRPILKDNKVHPICDAASSITAEITTTTSKALTSSVKELRNS